MSAEYIMAAGNENVILCERGIRTFETYTRNTLDLQSIPVLRKLTHLPIIIDPSHAGGKWWLVDPMAKASVAAGADGLMIEVHNNPECCPLRRCPVIKTREIRQSGQDKFHRLPSVVRKKQV